MTLEPTIAAVKEETGNDFEDAIFVDSDDGSDEELILSHFNPDPR